MNAIKHVNQKKKRGLKDLISVGNATLKDFDILGIKTVSSLSKKDAKTLYLQLCKLTKTQHDICVQDVFSAAIAQSRDPSLPLEKCNWWYWSKLRKENNAKENQ